MPLNYLIPTKRVVEQFETNHIIEECLLTKHDLSYYLLMQISKMQVTLDQRFLIEHYISACKKILFL
jgi:hypothetical protein